MKILAVSPYTSGGASGLTAPFSTIYNGFITPTSLKIFKEASALLLWGGSDIHPTLYGDRMHPKNEMRHCDEPTIRDIMEWHYIKEAQAANIPIIGICRGGQLLCAYAGGKLYQDVDGHLNSHEITTHDNETFSAPANHHQMMALDNLEETQYQVLAWSKQVRSNYRQLDTTNDDSDEQYSLVSTTKKEPEVVWFPEIRGLAIQPHPEWGPPVSAFNTWIVKTIKHYLHGE